MPEGPEVKLITEYLNSQIENQVITNIEFISGRYNQTIPQGFEEFYDNLPFLIEGVYCKGKFIYITCYKEDSRFHICHSLRMTGSWSTTKKEHTRWYFELKDRPSLYFSDPRNFATISFIDSDEELQEILSSLGPDIMTPEFTFQKWKSLLSQHPNKNITDFLMTQNIISGCGNYLKAECLYYSKISPHRKVHSLTPLEQEKLYEALNTIPKQCYCNQGVYYKDGYPKYNLQIYGNKNAKREKTPDGRITWWDPNHQF
jgi:DNA-formamidopyrimidine glycosylase